VSELNVEAVAAAAAAELTKDFLKSTYAKLTGATHQIFQRAFPKFEKHLQAVYQRNSQVKILANKDAPVQFDEIYVQSRFKSNEVYYVDREIVDLAATGKKLVVSAIGGAGKTFLLRFAWLTLFRQKSGKVPVFLELRKLNAVSSVSLESFIRASTFGADLSDANFQHFGDEGIFVFFLDGFDEVMRDKRADLENQIIEFSRKYPKCGIIVSGRPDDRFGGWQGFTSIQALPFGFDQFSELTNKIPFDQDIKVNFLKIANIEFFNQHESFLSNPLLSMMMLLTFRDNAEIPNKISTFYENCFATLFSQHDALKESFRRPKCLEQLEFRRVFAVFCLLTYRDNRPSVEQSEFTIYVEKARNFLNLQQDCTDIAHDFLESVNLMVKEGTNISFIHRSFQEFFSAVCATNVLPDDVSEVLNLFSRRTTDKTFKLAFEIHPALVNKEFLIPRYELLKTQKRLFTRRDSAKRFRACAAARVSVGFDTEVFKTREGRKPKTQRRIRRLHLSIDPEVDSFLFACDEAYLNSKYYEEMRSELFALFDISMRLVKGPKWHQSLSQDPQDWRFRLEFTENELAVSGQAITSSEPDTAMKLTVAATKAVEKEGYRFEAVLASLTRRALQKVEDAITLRKDNKFVFLRDDTEDFLD
jgi:hypothetical protein